MRFHEGKFRPNEGKFRPNEGKFRPNGGKSAKLRENSAKSPPRDTEPLVPVEEEQRQYQEEGRRQHRRSR